MIGCTEGCDSCTWGGSCTHCKTGYTGPVDGSCIRTSLRFLPCLHSIYVFLCLVLATCDRPPPGVQLNCSLPVVDGTPCPPSCADTPQTYLVQPPPLYICRRHDFEPP